MSKKSNIAKIDFILEMIDNINFIVKRHGTITQALSDIEGQMAILMAISQIGETLKKIDDDIIEKYNLKEDKRGILYKKLYYS